MTTATHNTITVGRRKEAVVRVRLIPGSGEFKLNVLFFFRRSVSINVKNGDFKRTDVNSNVAFDKIQ